MWLGFCVRGIVVYGVHRDVKTATQHCSWRKTRNISFAVSDPPTPHAPHGRPHAPHPHNLTPHQHGCFPSPPSLPHPPHLLPSHLLSALRTASSPLSSRTAQSLSLFMPAVTRSKFQKLPLLLHNNAVDIPNLVSLSSLPPSLPLFLPPSPPFNAGLDIYWSSPKHAISST